MRSSQNDTATLVLSGQILLPEFSLAIVGFSHLVSALHHDFGKGQRIDWAMDDLETSSAHLVQGRALASARGLWEDDAELGAVESVVEAYERFATAMRDKLPLTEFSPTVQKTGKELRGLLNGHIKAFRFETAHADIDIYPADSVTPKPGESPASAPLRITEQAHGSIRGRVESMSKRGGLRFTLYDNNDDLPVSCYLGAGQENLMRDIWGRMVVVEGDIRRDPLGGRATTIRQITNMMLLPEGGDTWNFRAARGASGWKPGDMPAEKALRLVRDG